MRRCIAPGLFSVRPRLAALTFAAASDLTSLILMRRPSSSTAPDEASRTAQSTSNMCQPGEIALASRSKSVAFLPSAADLEAASVAASTSDKELETKPLILGRAASDTV